MRAERSPELRLTPLSSSGHAGLTERGRAQARDAEGRGGAGGGREEEGEGRSWPGEELRAVGGYGVRRSGERCARASREARASGGGRKWERGLRRARPGAPGGRPGRLHAAACPPRGGQALPARHGGTARPSARADAGASARREKGKARAGQAGFGQRARSEAAAC